MEIVEIYTWQIWQSDFTLQSQTQGNSTPPNSGTHSPLPKKPFPYHFQKEMMTVSIAKVLLSRISQGLPLPVALVSSSHATLQLTGFPPQASLFLVTLLFQLCPLSLCCPLGLLSCALLLVSFAHTLFIFFSHIPRFCLMATSNLLALLNLLLSLHAVDSSRCL